MASISASVATPSAIRRFGNACTPSRRASSSRSLGGRYSTSSSERECEYGRMTWACTKAGPLRWRTYSEARSSTSYEATGSQPSTSSTSKPGNVLTSRDTEPPAVWTSTGTEIA